MGPRAATDSAAPPSEPEASPPSLRAFFGVGGIAGFGTAPGLSVGLTAHAGAGWRWLSASVEGRADLPASEDGPNGGRVSAALVSGSLVPCVQVLERVAGCAIGSLGVLRGEGEAVPDRRTDDTLFGAAGVRAAVAFPLEPPFGVRLTGDFGAVLTPTRLHLYGAEVWSSPPVYGALGIAGELGFGGGRPRN